MGRDLLGLVQRQAEVGLLHGVGELLDRGGCLGRLDGEAEACGHVVAIRGPGTVEPCLLRWRQPVPPRRGERLLVGVHAADPSTPLTSSAQYRTSRPSPRRRHPPRDARCRTACTLMPSMLAACSTLTHSVRVPRRSQVSCGTRSPQRSHTSSPDACAPSSVATYWPVHVTSRHALCVLTRRVPLLASRRMAARCSSASVANAYRAMMSGSFSRRSAQRAASRSRPGVESGTVPMPGTVSSRWWATYSAHSSTSRTARSYSSTSSTSLIPGGICDPGLPPEVLPGTRSTTG